MGKNEPVCIADEVPFEIPESWEWVRWGTLSESIQYGYNAPAQKNGRIKMVRISDIQDNSVIWETVPYCDIKEGKIDAYLLKPNDILFARTGGTVGKSYLVQEVPEEAIYAGYLIRTRYSNQLCPQYLKYFMESELYWSQLREGTIATAQPNCNGKTLGNMLVPIPPADEQIRIVEKLNAVMVHVIEYGTVDSKSKHLNNIFPERLKKSILQEAIQGKLVPQDPNAEPASVLLERIRAEKEKLIQEGKIKRDKHESVIFRRDNSHYEKLDGIERCIDDEIPFEIPDTWKWCRLGNIATVQSSKRVFEKDYVDEGIPFFRSKEIGDLHRGEGIHTQLFITKEHYDQLKKDYGVPQLGDILITSVGTIGNSWICDGRAFYYKDGNITQICANPYLFSQYIQLFINSPLFIEQAQSTVSGTAYNALTIIKLKNMLIPVPPLSEQHCIVEKQQKLFNKITLI